MKFEINLSRKIQLGVSLALVTLIVIGVVSYRSTVQFVESAEIVARSHKVISTLENFLADLTSVESEARGYVITGDEKYLKLYTTAIGDVDENQRELRQLATDTAVRARLVDLDRLTRQRLERLRVTVETRRLEGFEGVSKVSGAGKQIMDELREVVTEIENREQGLLVERDRLSKSMARRTIAVVTLGTVFTVLLAVTSVFVLTSDIVHRERLEREVLEISEREQRRIGQDLHDGVCQHLTGISLFSRSLQHKLDGKMPGEASEAARITDLINDSIEQTRRVTRGLHPVPDEPTGLILALRELAGHAGGTGNPACHFNCPEPVQITDQATATHLYRIAQEAVQNAVRHAKAHTIAIALKTNDEAIQMTVSDDGRGLPAHSPSTGMGLEIMKYRAHAIGAQLEIRGNDGRGTVIACTLPRSSMTQHESHARREDQA